MKKIFLVDDDVVIVQMYGKRLLRDGFNVEVARDGLEAMKMLPDLKPDLVVLDLMMPKCDGVEVLKFIRARPDLKTVPVVILSNAYMTELVQRAAAIGVEKALLKSSCTPELLIDVINALLSGAAMPTDVSALIAARAAAVVKPGPPSTVLPSPRNVSKQPGTTEVRDDSQAAARRSFLKNLTATLATIRQFHHAFVESLSPQARAVRLVEFYRRVHFVTAMAGVAGCGDIALFCGAFEALLFELQYKPELITPSTLQTIANSVAFLDRLFSSAAQFPAQSLASGRVLVVDDDPIASRAMTAALKHAGLQVEGAGDPFGALELLQHSQYDLAILDINLPEMDGFALYAMMRRLPDHGKTPVVFVATETDYEKRATSIFNDGNDVISKPILGIELAVKAVTHLLERRLSKPPDN
jgi:CheY-like chemotaxis protein